MDILTEDNKGNCATCVFKPRAKYMYHQMTQSSRHWVWRQSPWLVHIWPHCSRVRLAHVFVLQQAMDWFSSFPISLWIVIMNGRWMLCTNYMGQLHGFLLHDAHTVNYTDCFVNAKPALHSRDLPQGSWYITFFIFSWNGFASILLRNVVVLVYGFLFLVMILSGLQWM